MSRITLTIEYLTVAIIPLYLFTALNPGEIEDF